MNVKRKQSTSKLGGENMCKRRESWLMHVSRCTIVETPDQVAWRNAGKRDFHGRLIGSASGFCGGANSCECAGDWNLWSRGSSWLWFFRTK